MTFEGTQIGADGKRYATGTQPSQPDRWSVVRAADTPNDGEIPTWDAGTGRAAWQPAAAGGGGGAPDSYMLLELANGHTITAPAVGPGEILNEDCPFDTVYEEFGDAITWDVDDPTAVRLQPGWYSSYATVFYQFDPADLDTAYMMTQLLCGDINWQEVNPFESTKASGRTIGEAISRYWPLFLVKEDESGVDGAALKLALDVGGISNDVEVTWVEFTVVRLAPLA